jgi:hypothetical protein
MWLDAIVTQADLQTLVNQLTPATLPLGEKGHLYFDAPVDVTLVPDRGLRIQCHAKVMYPVLGIDVAVTIHSMSILVVPGIEVRDGDRVIVLTPEVEVIDLALLPNVGDSEVRAFLNRELFQKRVELPWNYRETLDHSFALPEWFRSASEFAIRTNGASIKVTSETLGLAIGFKASIEPTSGLDEAAHGDSGWQGSKNGHSAKSGDRHRNGSITGERAAGSKPRRSRSKRLGLGIAVGFGVGCLLGLWSTSRS